MADKAECYWQRVESSLSRPVTIRHPHRARQKTRTVHSSDVRREKRESVCIQQTVPTQTQHAPFGCVFDQPSPGYILRIPQPTVNQGGHNDLIEHVTRGDIMIRSKHRSPRGRDDQLKTQVTTGVIMIRSKHRSPQGTW